MKSFGFHNRFFYFSMRKIIENIQKPHSILPTIDLYFLQPKNNNKKNENKLRTLTMRLSTAEFPIVLQYFEFYSSSRFRIALPTLCRNLRGCKTVHRNVQTRICPARPSQLHFAVAKPCTSPISLIILYVYNYGRSNKLMKQRHH